jgi:hypothetical protein
LQAFCYVRTVRTLGFLVVVPLLAACRFGFQDQPDSQPPPPPPAIDAAPDAPPPVLACGRPARFPMATAPTFVTATATASGYNLITGDASGVHGFAYNFVDNTLVADRGDVLLFRGATGELSTIANGDHTLVGVTSGTPLNSTSVIALNAQLVTLGMPATHDTWIGGLGSLARNSTGTVAFLGTKVDSSEVDAQVIADDGAASGPPHIVVPDGTSPTIAASGADFLVTWNAANSVHAAVHTLTSDSIVTKVGAQTISSSDPLNEAFNARGAYSAASDTYLFSWMQKPGDPLDHILMSLRDRGLNELGGGPQDIGMGNMPIVVAGKDDYLVAWRIDAVRLGAARVKPDGSVLPVPIEGTAQNALGMDLVVREGQPALVWIESDVTGGGATVRFDPLCSP